MKVSLIVPIYNAEKTLMKCLASIKSQIYQNLQIILINDGSTDNSGLICNEFAREDKRFSVIHQENKGVSAARNEGIKNSVGEYIGFIDADDYIEVEMISNLIKLNKRKHADVLMCKCHKHFNNNQYTKKNYIDSFEVMTKEKAINGILNKNEYHGYACNKLFSTKLIKENNILFDENIYVCEDLLFCIQNLINSDLIIYDENEYYNYIFHESNTSSLFNSKKTTAIDAYEKILLNLDQVCNIRVDDFKNAYFTIMVSLLMQSIYASRSKTTKLLLGKINSVELNSISNWKLRMIFLSIKFDYRIIYFFWKKRRQ